MSQQSNQASVKNFNVSNFFWCGIIGHTSASEIGMTSDVDEFILSDDEANSKQLFKLSNVVSDSDSKPLAWVFTSIFGGSKVTIENC